MPFRAVLLQEFNEAGDWDVGTRSSGVLLLAFTLLGSALFFSMASAGRARDDRAQQQRRIHR